MKIATHKSFPDEVVKFKPITSGLAKGDILVQFKSGEKTTMSSKRFNEIFEVK